MTAHIYNEKIVTGDSKSNENKLAFEYKYDMIYADGKTDAQTVLLPVIDESTANRKIEI